MPSAPVLRTTRLTLRPPTSADRDAWVALHRDPRTYTHAPHAMSQTDEDAAAFLDLTIAHWDRLGYGYHVATIEDVVVGVAGVRRYDGDDPFHNVYYRLGFDYLGLGLGKEMSRAVSAHAIEHLPVLPVRALVKEHNHASVRTAVATGMERVGTRVLSDDRPDEVPSTVFEAPRADAVSAFDGPTREQVLDLWMRTNDAGGAVGFLPGASRDRVDAALGRHEESMASRSTTAVVLRSAADSRVAGLAFVVPVGTPLMPHVASVGRVMTEPTMRGRNLGRLLMAGVHRVARGAGIEILTLGVRSGMGTSAFYEACGYHEAGRVVGAIRVGPGDDRDDITMTRRLDDAVTGRDPRN